MSEPIKAMDVSNYQPRDLSDLIHRYQVQHVVVRLWLPEEKPDPGYALDQIWSAQTNGCTVGGYYWGYALLAPEKSVEDALTLWQRANVGTIPILWPDIETYAGEGCPDEDWTNRACRAAEGSGIRTGPYLADWVIEQWWQRTVGDEMRARTAWFANYNGQPDLNVPTNYWEPANILGHQYVGSPIDLDVFDVSVTTVDAPAPAQPSYEELQSSIGYLTGDLMNGFESEANRKPIRKSQLLSLVELGRAQALN